MTERDFQGKEIKLKGKEFTVQEPIGSLYFVHGISANWVDYTMLLVPLKNMGFNVFAYNQRGHGNSPGQYDPKIAADDLEHILENEAPSSRLGIIGHSIGCYTALEVVKRYESTGWLIDGVFMIEPFLGMDFLNLPQRYCIKALSKIASPLKVVDRWLNSAEKFREKNGFHQRDVIASYASLAGLHSDDVKGIETKVGFMLTDNDEVLGTSNKKHFYNCLKRIWKVCPNYTDHSVEVSGLNHCLNANKNDMSPFLNDNPLKYSKDPDLHAQMLAKRANIVYRIGKFFRSAFENT